MSAVFNWVECVRRMWIEDVKPLNQNETEEKNNLYIKNTLYKRPICEHWRGESLGLAELVDKNNDFVEFHNLARLSDI